MSSDVTFQNYIPQSPHILRVQGGKKERKSSKKKNPPDFIICLFKGFLHPAWCRHTLAAFVSELKVELCRDCTHLRT